MVYPAASTSSAPMAQGNANTKRLALGAPDELRNSKPPSPIPGNFSPLGHMPSVRTQLTSNFFSLLNMPGKTEEVGSTQFNPLSCMAGCLWDASLEGGLKGPEKPQRLTADEVRERRGQGSLFLHFRGTGHTGSAHGMLSGMTGEGIKLDGKQAICFFHLFGKVIRVTIHFGS